MDALCYFGELDSVILAASRALREGGAFVFTLEKAEESHEAFALREHARYVHASEHVMGLLRASGFRAIGATEHALRLDYGGPVIGLVFTASLDPRAPVATRPLSGPPPGRR